MKSRRRPWQIWFGLVGCAGMLGLFLALAPIEAQTQPDDQPKKKKETKPEPKRPKTPEVRDILVVGTGGIDNIRIINETIEKAWADNKIEPSERCTDFEFIRRASLDIIGRIAKVHEIERFLRDPAERRRSMLIERLMGLEKGSDQNTYADEYATNWSRMWTTMLLTRSGTAERYQEAMRVWLQDQFLDMRAEPTKLDDSPVTESPAQGALAPRAPGDPADWSKIVAKLLTAEGDTNDNQATAYILAHLGDPIPRDARAANGAFDMVPVTSRTTRLFLGLRTQCVQCHDHPFNDEWGQHHFWGINAFFRQVDAPLGRLPSMMGKMKKDASPIRNLREDTSLNPKSIVPYERRTGVFLFTDPTFLNGKKMKLKSGSNRRKELANFVINSPYFAKAYVNRTWGHFFGRGMTRDSVDDFGEHNTVVFPQLLKTLAEDWSQKYSHDPKILIRWICNSRPYGLSSVANPRNDKQEDEMFFARMLTKAMSPEQLFESLITATDSKVGQSKESRDAARKAWMDKLIVGFGDDEGNETSYNGTVVQALMLMNGDDMHKAISDKENGTVAAVLKKRAFSQTAAKDAMKDLFLAALNRPPRAEEYNRMLNPKMFLLPRVPGATRDAPAFWTGFYQDMFWAILNSNEFILNH